MTDQFCASEVKSCAYDVTNSSKPAPLTCASRQNPRIWLVHHVKTRAYDASSSSKPAPMMSASVINHWFPIHDNLATCPNLPSPNLVSSKVNFFHIFFLAKSSIHNRTNADFSSNANIVLRFPTAIGCHSLLTQTYVVCLTYLIEILSHTYLPWYQIEFPSHALCPNLPIQFLSNAHFQPSPSPWYRMFLYTTCIIHNQIIFLSYTCLISS